MRTHANRTECPQCGHHNAGEYLGKPVGTLRAKLEGFLAETDPAQWFAKFESLLFAWTGADAIPAGTMTNALEARRAQVLEKAYGQSFQKPSVRRGEVNVKIRRVPFRARRVGRLTI